MKKIYLLLPLFLFMVVGCNKNEEGSKDPMEEKVALYKQKILGEWTLVGVKYRSSDNYETPLAVTRPNFKSDGSLIFMNNPRSRHTYFINNYGKLEVEHIDALTNYMKHEILKIEFQDNYDILILGPDLNGNKDKYQRK